MEEEIRLDLGPSGMTIWGLRLGSPGGARILALHGWLDNAASFLPLGRGWEGVDLVALDLPGHGRSDHRAPSAFYHLVDYAFDVLDAADALGWDRFHLLGHSLGAGVATVAAATEPERVDRLLLIEGLGPMTSEADEQPEALRRHRKRRKRGSRGAPVYPDAEAAARARSQGAGLDLDAARLLVSRSLRRARGDDDTGEDDMGDDEGRDDEGRDGLSWSSDPRLRYPSPLPFTEAHVHALLRGIPCPTLLVSGEDGESLAPDRFEARRACLVDFTHRILPGRHHLHMEAPDPVREALMDFLAPGTQS